MSAGKNKMQWSTDGLEALIFDLDGVITRTAALHMKAWQQMFESYFQKYRKETDGDIEPYKGKEDYLKYIDGKPRYDGVKSLLESRDINLDYGDPEDGPDKETICGLGNRKNKIFLDLMKKEGVQVFDDTIKKIKKWRKRGTKNGSYIFK